MPKIGVSQLFAAKQTESGSTVSYSLGKKLAKLTKIDVSIESEQDNDFYADNAISESDKAFSSGTVKVTPDDLEDEDIAYILGLKTAEVTVGSAKVTEIVHDDDADAPNLGIGFIIKRKRNNVVKWRAVVFTKVKFSESGESAETQGDKISWQTTEYEGKIMRDSSEKHNWKREATCATEDAAAAYIKTVLGITEVV